MPISFIADRAIANEKHRQIECAFAAS